MRYLVKSKAGEHRNHRVFRIRPDSIVQSGTGSWMTTYINSSEADSGGNTDELYEKNGRLKMAQSLVEQHPDCVSLTWKWNRWQHLVDYSKFKKNKLVFIRPKAVEEIKKVWAADRAVAKV